jgi:hypothetical protein
MPLLTTQEIDDVSSTTLQYRIATLIDQVYVGTPLFKMLDMKERILADGGTRIEQPFLYAKGPGGSYRGWDTLDIARRRTKSLMVFEWKQYFAAVSVDGLSRLRSAGVNAVIDMIDSELQAAELTLKESLGTDVFLDGTANDGKALDGLDLAISSTGSYGGIARATDPEGLAIVGNRDSVGGTLTLPAIQSSWGNATHGNEHVSAIITTQNLFDQIWNRVQPQQRFPQTGTGEQLAAAGFNVIMFNGIPVVVDEMCPAGTLWGLNTNFIKLIAHQARANIEMQGPIDAINQDGKVWKLFWMGNLIVQAPRFMFVMTGLDE